MKVQELRIGNWVYCNKSYINKPVKITGISVVDRRDDHTGIYEEFIYLNEHDLLKEEEFNDKWIHYKQGVLTPEDITPIPITEQILLDCGFEKLGENYWGIEHFKISFQQDKFWYLFENYSVDFNIPDIEINSLHALQNLYYALTGTELTYQPRPIW